MHQTFNENRKQRVSENVDRPEHSPLNLAHMTGVLLLFASIGWFAFFVLGIVFGTYGNNAEDHAAVAFAAYHQHPLTILLIYYGSMVVGFLFIVLAPLCYLNVARSHTPLKLIAAIFQVLAGSIQALAASRWVIMLPVFAQIYTDPQTSAATHAALDVTYQAISYFFGLTLGEHFYYIFTGGWSLLVSISLLRTPGQKIWLGWLGVVAGTLLLLGSFEQLNFSFGNLLLLFVFGGIVTWLIWAVSLASTLLTNKGTILKSNAPRETLTHVVSSYKC
jgi:hypothetical protein